MNTKYDIFISYRRSTGKEIARPLKEALTNMGYNVFLDFDELNDGLFNERIVQAIKEAPVFMIILSAHSLDRCCDENDWVRKEIELALSESKQIVPINPDKQFTGFPDGLPVPLYNTLAHHQISSLDTEQLFKESLAKIVDNRVASVIKPKNKSGRIKVAFIAAIAALVIVIGAAAYFFSGKESKKEKEDTVEKAFELVSKAETMAKSGETQKAGTLYLQAADLFLTVATQAEDYSRATNNYEQLFHAYMYYNNAGIYYGQAGHYDKSVEALYKSLSAINRVAVHNGNDNYNSYQAYTLEDLTYAYAMMEDWDKALAAINQALEFCPDNANDWDSKGEILLKLGDLDGAREALRKAFEIDPYFTLNDWAKELPAE